VFTGDKDRWQAKELGDVAKELGDVHVPRSDVCDVFTGDKDRWQAKELGDVHVPLLISALWSVSSAL